MKRKHYILGILATLCFLGTGGYAWSLHDAYLKQVAEWNEGAKAAFEEALWIEVNKRAEIPMYYSSYENGRTFTLKDDIPDSVFIMTPMGRRGYRNEKEKYENNFIKDRKKRVIMGILLVETPLSVDTLAMSWGEKMLAREIPAYNRIRYINTDWNLQNDTVYSVADGNVGLDSLLVSYLGLRNEHELVGYVSYPCWLMSLFPANLFWMLFPWLIVVLLNVFYTPVEVFFRRKFVKEKIIKTEIHVPDVPAEIANIYLLSDGIFFDSFEHTLIKEGFTHTLSPQPALLLKLFLRKENRRLSIEEIDEGLWKGKGTIDKIYKVIQRLRAELKKVSPDLVIKNVNGDYELKLPISSNNWLKMTADNNS